MLLLDDGATRSKLLELLEETLPHQIGKNDRLLLYFAGHGIALNGENGPEGYLSPRDASLGDSRGYLSMSRTRDALQAIQCRHFLGILDCCFAGAFRWSSTRDLCPVPEVIHRERYERYIVDPAWQVIASAAPDQKALDSFPNGRSNGTHSPFAAALIEALQGAGDIFPASANGASPGDGAITATELYLYLRDRVESIAEAGPVRQTPGIWPLPKHGKGEYIFLNPRKSLALPDAPPLNEFLNPYRGLQPFEEEHRDLFFGREQLTLRLARFVNDQPLTVLIGVSGCGKSSLLKAGLIPYLKSAPGENWRILPPLRPGEFPLEAIERAIGGELLSALADFFTTDPTAKLLMAIDQFEEFFTLYRDARERDAALTLLSQALGLYPERFRLVITLRSDFEPRLQDSPLASHWKAARFILPAMNRECLREAIEKPAFARVLYFQSDDPQRSLVEQLLDEVEYMPGTLPLLSFTLSELYLKYLQRQQQARRRGETIDRAITEADYQESGGVILSLTRRAEREYEALVREDPARGPDIERVMLRMVVVGEGENARRRVSLDELTYSGERNDRVREILRHFSEARLLVGGRDPDGNPYIEPAHDALIASWPRLLLWRQQAQVWLPLQRRLTPVALEWRKRREENKPSDRFLWDHHPTLDYLATVLKSAENWFDRIEEEFVRSSLRKRSGDRALRWAIAGAVLAGSLVFSAIVWREWRRAEYNLAESLGRFSASLFDSGQELQAMIAAIEAGTLPHDRGPIDPTVQDALQTTLYWTREKNRLIWHRDTVNSVAFSPDGRTIASGGSDGTIALWNRAGQLLRVLDGRPIEIDSVAFFDDRIIVASNDINTIDIWRADGKHLATLTGHRERVNSIAVDRRSNRIVSGSDDGTIRLWTTGGKALRKFPRQPGSIRRVRFSPDGNSIAAVGDNGLVQLWDRAGKSPRTLSGHRGIVRAIAFSPDGKFLVSGGDDRFARVWTRDGRSLGNLGENDYPIRDIVFRPDGNALAVAGEDGSVHLWNRNGELLDSFRGHGGEALAVAFSLDGKTLASASEDETVKLWSPDNSFAWKALGTASFYRLIYRPDGMVLASAGADARIWLWTRWGQPLQVLSGHRDAINAIAYSPDGKTLVSGSSDQTLILWDERGRATRILRGHRGEVFDTVFSPDGRILASASGDRTVRLWDRQGNPLAILHGHRKAVKSLAFSPDGRWLAAGGEDRTIRIWDHRGRLIRSIDTRLGEARSLVFSPDGRSLVAGGSRDRIQFWSLEGRLLRSISGHAGGVRSLAFSADGRILGSAGADRTAKLWKTDGTLWRTLYGHAGAVRGIAFSPDGQFVTTAGDDGRILIRRTDILSLDWKSWIVLNCRWAQDYLRHSAEVTEREKHLCDGEISP
jgi:WD40 repeat protein